MASEIDLPALFSCGKTWSVESLLGKGKSGYSYLVRSGTDLAVWKKIHHEPVTYYSFGDKLQAEINAYDKLKASGLNVPQLFEVNKAEEWLLKEFIPGPTLAEQVGLGTLPDEIWNAIFELSACLQKKQMNVDFFPTNFIWHEQRLFYVDYEWNPYLKEWDFENWGIWYWVNNNGMNEFLKTGNHRAINKDDNSGKPQTKGLEEQVATLLNRFGAIEKI
ncbi:MAG: hypothetical protein LCH54_12190 [Bacteroidetes bacterium]|nr:hypothetical protein [Bacteroidota bacterium]